MKKIIRTGNNTLWLGRQNTLIKRQGTLNPPLKQGREQTVKWREKTLLQVFRGGSDPWKRPTEGFTARVTWNPSLWGGRDLGRDPASNTTQPLWCSHETEGWRAMHDVINKGRTQHNLIFIKLKCAYTHTKPEYQKCYQNVPVYIVRLSGTSVVR